MASRTLSQGTPIVWRNSGGNYGFSPASLANNAAREGAKGDLGSDRPPAYSVDVAIELGGAPTAGLFIEFFWAASINATAGSDNPGGATGVDSAYMAGQEDEWKIQLIPLGVIFLTNDANIQKSVINPYFVPPTRYGMPVMVNKSAQTLQADNDEHFIRLTPINEAIA